MTADTSIHTRALLVWLTITAWSARRYDKGVTQKVNAQYAATTDAGRYNKMLLPGDAPSYKALVTLTGAIRQEHYTNTLSWSDEGWRLLPTANYIAYTDWVRTRQADLDRARDLFLADYPDMKIKARTLLNGLYNDSDYPSVDDLRSRFALSLSYMPLPAEGDIRVDLASDQVEYIESQIQSKVRDSIQTAMQDAYSRLAAVVSSMADRLSDPEAVFRDSLVSNIRDTVDALARLNVTNDPQLEQFRHQAIQDLAKYDPQSLRDFPRVRSSVAAKANAILDAMKKNGMVIA